MPYILLALVPAAFGLNPVIARALVGHYEPATLTVIRWLLSALLIGGVALARGRREIWRIETRDVPRLIFLGAMGMGFCSFAAYAGVKSATATTVGLIYACTAVAVAAVEIVEGTTRISVLLVTGLVACLLGVAVLLTEGDVLALSALTIGPGEVWAVAGTVVWAGYTLAMRSKPSGMTPLALFTTLALLGAAFAAPIAGLEVLDRGLPPLGANHALWLAALILLSSIAGFLGYNLSIRLSGPILTAACISLTPVYIAFQASYLLGEAVELFHVIAIALQRSGVRFPSAPPIKSKTYRLSAKIRNPWAHTGHTPKR
jgi:drug/metabolite transporter (DMT)-like permease